MFRNKKLLTSALFIAVLGLFGWTLAPKAFADVNNQQDVQGARFEFVNHQLIRGTFGDQIVTFRDSNPGDDTYNYLPPPNVFCDEVGGITLIGEPFAQGNTDPIQANIALRYVNVSGNCVEYNSPQPKTIFEAANARGSLQEQEEAGDGSCGLNSGGFSLSWLMCPVLEAADSVAGYLYEEFEQMLSFTIDEDLGDPASQNKVRTTWSLIKNVASAGVVIVMLVMIISQAIGGSWFDAYTVRKMLPRLIVATIAIQLSWPIFAWVVNLFDDIGNGIASFMFAPFGGREELQLGSVLANAGISGAEAAAINWLILLPALGFLAVAALPTVLVMALSALVALGVAYFTLILREIIIIMCLILAPLALLAWVLPGTQRYWKLWWDNFLKMLAMFPLAIALIASGRIFAYVAGTQQDTEDVDELISLIIICVGFFGPLFLLPRTFKWGGAALGLAYNAINSAGQRGIRAWEPAVKGYTERKQGQWANEYDVSAPAFERDLTRRKIFGKQRRIIPSGRFVRRIQSGHYLPTERSRRQTIALGDKYGGERNDEATAYVNNVALNAFHKGFRHPVTGEFVKDEETGNIKRGVEGQKLAMNEIAGNAYKTEPEKRAARLAVHRMRESSSWIEFQNAGVLSGPNSGRRIVELPAWRDQLVRDGSDYSAVIGARPDLAPDVIESAQQKVAQQVSEQEGKHVDLGSLSVDQHNAFTRKHQAEIDKMRLLTALSRAKPGDFGRVHFGFFDDIAKLNDAHLSTTLGERLKDAYTNGGVEGVNAVSALTSPGTESKVNKALGNSADPRTRTLRRITGKEQIPDGEKAGVLQRPSDVPQRQSVTEQQEAQAFGGGGAGGQQEAQAFGGGGAGGQQEAQAFGGGGAGLREEVYAGMSQALREERQRQQGGQPTTVFQTTDGELRIEHAPTFQPGDTIRPVEGTNKHVVFPSGVEPPPPTSPSS